MPFPGSQKIKMIINKDSLPGSKFLFQNTAPRYSDSDIPGRAAFCISRFRRAGMTVEAALAVPLFFLTLLSMIGLLEIYASFATTVVSLQQKAEAAGMLFSAGEGSQPIRLTEAVKAEMPFLPFSAGTLKIRAGACVLPWTGRKDCSDSPGTGDGKLYYLSDYESVYHTSSGCSYLSLQIKAESAAQAAKERNTKGDRYTPCEMCIGGGACNSLVYLTAAGEHYHNSAACSGLKRSVHLVGEEEIQGKHLCTRCMKQENTS